MNLGKDVFTDGAISPATMEACVAVLRDYRRVLEQYGLSPGGRGLSGGGAGGRAAGGGRLRVVATSAVREATNRLTFLDRVFAATGIEIEPIDEAETTRVTYLGVLPYLQEEPDLHSATVAVAEVGGGTTDVLAIRGGDVRFSQSYRVGALRMREAVRAAARRRPADALGAPGRPGRPPHGRRSARRRRRVGRAGRGRPLRRQPPAAPPGPATIAPRPARTPPPCGCRWPRCATF